MSSIIRFACMMTMAFLAMSKPLTAQIVNDLERASDSDSRSNCGSDNSSSSSSGGSSYESTSWDNSSSSSDDDGYRYSSGDDNSSGGSYSDGYTLGDADMEWCGDVILAPFRAVYNAQDWMLGQKEQVRRMVSVEAQVPLGVNLDGYFTFSPEVRANWGLFSTGFRYLNLTEPSLEGRRSWITYDIEALQLNLLQTKGVRLMVGTGVTIQDYQGLPFHEYLAGLDFHLLQDRLVLANEGRISTDYCGCDAAQRMEYNAALRLRVMDTQHFSLYSTYNYMRQTYYGSVRVWTAGAGLSMLLH